MKKIILLFFSFLFAIAGNIIIQYPNLKPKYYENQIVSLQIKIITSDEENLTLNTPEYIKYNITSINPFTHIITLKFKAIKDRDYKFIIAGNTFYQPLDITNKINITPLSKINNFSDFIAKDLNIENPISSKYDENFNMVSFTVNYTQGNIKDFFINSPFIKEQNITIISDNKASFYAIVDKKLKELTFYYFNLNKDNYEKIKIPINIKEEKISTQTDINPEENTLLKPLNIFLLTLILISLLIAIFIGSKLLGIIPLLLTILLISLNLPKSTKIIKAHSKIYILPIESSTIFLETSTPQKVKILKTYKDYSKIEINKKIGWVKNENLY